MASYGFKLNLPHGTRSVSGPTFGQKLGRGFSHVAPYSSLIGAMSSGLGFFSELAKPDYSGTGMTSQEIRQAKKQDDYGTAVQGVNFALQLLSTILSFV